MTIDQLLSGLLSAGIFLQGVLALVALALIVLQIFATIVGIRFLFFLWRALGFAETAIEEASLKRRGLWGAASPKELEAFHQSQRFRWRYAIAGIYVLWLGSIIVALLLAFNQPLSAWPILLVMVVLLILIGVVIALN